MHELTTEELVELANKEFDDPDSPFPWEQVNRWLDRGDGVAVYRNEDLGHRDLGRTVFVSYGSDAAQIPPTVAVIYKERTRVEAFLNPEAAESWKRHAELSHFGEEYTIVYNVPTAPTTLPDGLFRDVTGGINWRYRLVGVYEGDQIVPVDPDAFNNENWAAGTAP